MEELRNAGFADLQGCAVVLRINHENPSFRCNARCNSQAGIGFAGTAGAAETKPQFKVNAPSLKYDHTGKYAEYSEFAYVEPVYAARA